MGRVAGKVALITGAARGQGRSHALRLAEEGADIIAIDICSQIDGVNYGLATPEDLAETVELVEKFGQRILPIQADVRDLSAMKAAVDQAVNEFGKLDIVSANAGISPLGPLPLHVFLDVVNVNLSGVINTVTAAIDHLSAGASIVVTSSVAAMMKGGTEGQGPGGSGYTFAKRTLVDFVKDLARTLAPHSIRVNTILPTNVNTPMLHTETMYRLFRPDLENPTREEAEVAFATLALMPIPYVEPSDISEALLYFASDASRYVTGQVLAVDGGQLLHDIVLG
ncbi:mycofactocin-coupled SDR family oxidoreductase [Nocardia fluminea]|uniref:mycofactocin-coupled SDR family oxidoreductase n=1 Tax=Nocardia fluminea TaxID=134984 RepID=UPI00343CEBF5